MKPQRNTEAGEEDTEWEKIYSSAVRARKIFLCILILNSDFSLCFMGTCVVTEFLVFAYPRLFA